MADPKFAFAANPEELSALKALTLMQAKQAKAAASSSLASHAQATPATKRPRGRPKKVPEVAPVAPFGPSAETHVMGTTKRKKNGGVAATVLKTAKLAGQVAQATHTLQAVNDGVSADTNSIASKMVAEATPTVGALALLRGELGDANAKSADQKAALINQGATAESIRKKMNKQNAIMIDQGESSADFTKHRTAAAISTAITTLINMYSKPGADIAAITDSVNSLYDRAAKLGIDLELINPAAPVAAPVAAPIKTDPSTSAAPVKSDPSSSSSSAPSVINPEVRPAQQPIVDAKGDPILDDKGKPITHKDVKTSMADTFKKKWTSGTADNDVVKTEKDPSGGSTEKGTYNFMLRKSVDKTTRKPIKGEWTAKVAGASGIITFRESGLDSTKNKVYYANLTANTENILNNLNDVANPDNPIDLNLVSVLRKVGWVKDDALKKETLDKLNKGGGIAGGAAKGKAGVHIGQEYRLDKEALAKMKVRIVPLAKFRKDGTPIRAKAVYSTPLTVDLYKLLNEKYDHKHEYSPAAIEAYRKINQFVPLKPGPQSAKAKILRGKPHTKAAAASVEIIPDNPDEWQKMLEVNLGLIDAGNTSTNLRNQSVRLTDMLAERGIITPAQAYKLHGRIGEM